MGMKGSTTVESGDIFFNERSISLNNVIACPTFKDWLPSWIFMMFEIKHF